MKGVTLDTIGGGALPELFAAEIARVLQNIADPNTDPKQKRTISITVDFKPNRDRDAAETTVKIGSKVAGMLSVDTKLFIGKHGGKWIAVENDPRQGGLFDKDKSPLTAVTGNFGANGNGNNPTEGEKP